jgi:hypothetical protein
MKLSKHNQFYESEITQFISDMKKQNPHLEEAQRDGRAIFWDKTPIDLDQRQRAEQSRVKQKPYVYQNK